MPVYATRKIRNLAAILVMLSGITHIAQLWFRELDNINLLTALMGTVYLLLALGLSGQSRFTLWATSVMMITGAVAGGSLLQAGVIDPLLIWHMGVDVTVPALCLYILYRTRYADMD